MNKELINIAKEVWGKKSDAIVCWKPKHSPNTSHIPPSLKEKKTNWFSTRKFNSGVKRIWIYVIYQEKKQLECIMKVTGERKYYGGAINTIEDNAKFSHIYEVEILYKFKNQITLPELKQDICTRMS